jgi:uncharacterized protein YbjT (DUF2867 family)
MDGAAGATRRTALVAGATGLVGRAILQGLLADEGVAAVHALARRPLAIEHPRLTTHLVDFAALPALPAVDEAYLALGTTIKVAGSQPAFRAVDFDANLAVARAVGGGGPPPRRGGCAQGAAGPAPQKKNPRGGWHPPAPGLRPFTTTHVDEIRAAVVRP